MSKKVKVLVLRTAGVNCEAEMVEAWERAGAQPILRHINELSGPLATDKLENYAILGLPGGFAYGDDLGAGKLLANDLLYRLKEPFATFVETGRPVLGICNGFQVLAKAGVFGEVTLAANRSGIFQCRWTWLKTTGRSNCIFTEGLERVYLPVAHGEGRVALGGTSSEATLRTLEEKGQVVFRYTDEAGGEDTPFPFNPNGSVAGIAGLCNPGGTVFGLMPHPERYISPFQHPHWTRFKPSDFNRGEGDGLKIFKNAVAYAAR